MRKNATEPVTPVANAMAETHKDQLDAPECSPRAVNARKPHSVSDATRNTIARHSKGGSCHVSSDNGGHVAHNGMAIRPISVQALDEIAGRVARETAEVEVTLIEKLPGVGKSIAAGHRGVGVHLDQVTAAPPPIVRRHANLGASSGRNARTTSYIPGSNFAMANARSR